MGDDVVYEWLARVQADLDGAWSCARGERPSLTVAAYLVQQAAEKLIKAVLVAEGTDPPRTHDLEDLAALLGDKHRGDHRFHRLTRFTSFSTAFRYPGEDEGEHVPSAAEINSWVEEIEALKADFEQWLAAR